jgi:hypothetical protein
MTRRIVAALSVFALVATLLVGVSAPAKAQAPTKLTNATGCGTNLGNLIDLDSAILAFAPITKEYGVRVDCVVGAAPIDLGFFVLPFNFVAATSAFLIVEVQTIGLGITVGATARLKGGTVDTCLFGTNIQLTGVNPNKARVECIALRTGLKNNSLDWGQLLQITNSNFDLVGWNPGSVNGMQPFRGLGGLLSILNPIITPLIQAIIPGPLTEDVRVFAS